MQAGDPTLQAILGFFSPTNQQKPKSAILAVPFFKNMLAVFKSRWIMPCSSTQIYPETISLMTLKPQSSEKTPYFLICFNRSPPSQNSVIKYTLFLVMRISIVLRTLGCFIVFNALTSLLKRYFQTSFWTLDNSMTLIAIVFLLGSDYS